MAKSKKKASNSNTKHQSPKKYDEQQTILKTTGNVSGSIFKVIILVAVLGVAIAYIGPGLPEQIRKFLSQSVTDSEKAGSDSSQPPAQPVTKPKNGVDAKDENKQTDSVKKYPTNHKPAEPGVTQKPAEPGVTQKPAEPGVTQKTAEPEVVQKPAKKVPKLKENVPKQNSKKAELPPDVKNFKSTILNTFTPKKIFQDGRRIPPIELLHQKKVNSSIKVYLFDEFLSEQECDGLMKAHDRHVAETSKQNPIVCFDSVKTLRRHLQDAKKGKMKVTPQVFTSGTTCLNKTFSSDFKTFTKENWSYSTAFYPGENKFSKMFAARVEKAMGLLDKNGGKFQITSYPEGIGYKKHTDCIVGNQDQRDRFATVLVYLKDVEEGGETKFPDLGIWVKPRKGRALVWTNMNEKGECDPHSIHDASIVKKGHKYILQRWFYYKSFYSLGKRPPEPQLPARDPGQPRVSCDEYEHGSCRWYDEWNYDHILEYQQQQLTLI